MNKLTINIALIGINFVYALVSVCTKYASEQEMWSTKYIIGFGGAIVVMGIYAVLWQQVLKRIELSTAYMFKGTSLIFVMILAALLFGETIIWTNILGAAIIITGIALYSWVDRKEAEV